MPDKLTNSEIVKALECCMDEMGCIKGCPCFDPKAKGSHCTVSKKLELEKLTLDLINRLQEENETLRDVVKQNYLIRNNGKSPLSLIKAEAYQEFAEKAIDRVEKARQKYRRLCKEQGEEMDETMNIHFNGIVNLLKEMVGEDK